MHKSPMLKYTRVAKIGGWDAYLKIDNQEFCVCEQTTKRRAKWFAEMLAVALEKLVEAESK